MDAMRESAGKKVAWISLWANIILTLSKVIIGVIAGSEAVFADGIHSGADVIASIIVLIVIGIANKPADEEHPYGHGKAEVIISGVVGIILLFVSVYVVYEGIMAFFHPVESPKLIAMWIALISYVAKVVLYRYSLNTAVACKSKAIEAIAYDHKADIAASLIAAIGVGVAIAGTHFGWPALLYADAVASIIVAYLIFKIAKEMFNEAFHILMERNVDGETIQGFINIIHQFPDVRRIDRLRAREHGHYLLLDLRIAVDHGMTIKEGHDLGRMIKHAIMKQFDNVEEVLIHLNPFYPEDTYDRNK